MLHFYNIVIIIRMHSKLSNEQINVLYLVIYLQKIKVMVKKNMEQLSWQREYAQKHFLACIQQNNIVLGSSDTVPGLYGALTLDAKNKLDMIKKRDKKPYIVLVSDYHKAYALADTHQSLDIGRIMQQVWPGPVTLIFRAADHVPDWMKSPDHTIAVRVPDKPYLQQVLSSIPGVFSTSANISGQLTPHAVSQVDPDIMLHVSAIVYDSAGDAPLRASTILDCTGSSIRIIRQGSYVPTIDI